MNMSMFALNSDFLQELLCLTQAIRLYTESVQGGIPQRETLIRLEFYSSC